MNFKHQPWEEAKGAEAPEPKGEAAAALLCDPAPTLKENCPVLVLPVPAPKRDGAGAPVLLAALVWGLEKLKPPGVPALPKPEAWPPKAVMLGAFSAGPEKREGQRCKVRLTRIRNFSGKAAVFPRVNILGVNCFFPWKQQTLMSDQYQDNSS